MFLHVSVILSRGGVSQHALQVVSQHALQQVSRGCVSQHALQVSRPTPKRELEGSGLVGSLQAHTQGGVQGSGLGGGGLQAHTQGGSWGVLSGEGLQAHTGGRGGFSRLTPKRELEGSGLAGGSPGPHPGEFRGLAWGGSPGPHPRGKLRGLTWGGSPGPHLGGGSPGSHPGGIPVCTQADPPPSPGWRPSHAATLGIQV